MADLSCFATKEKADEGVYVPVKIRGVKLPLAIQIYGSDSDIVKEFERERIRKVGILKNTSAKIDDDTVDKLLDSQEEGILVRIGNIKSYDWKKRECNEEPLVLFERELKNDRKSKEFLIEQIPDIKDFVNEYSNERSNFLSDVKKN